MSYTSQPVHILCHELLDKIENAVGTQKKKLILKEYLNDWRRKYGYDHLNDLLRLIMPELCGRMYNLKELTLANVICKALSISPDSQDGRYLKTFRRPQANNRPSGVFHKAVFEVLKSRSTVSSSSQTLRDLNQLLDELSTRNPTKEEAPYEDEEDTSVSTGQKHLRVFKKMVDLYTPHQIQWIIRIILKDMNYRLSEQSILSQLHPNAKEKFDQGGNLKDICDMMANPERAVDNLDGVKLFSPCKPQLGLRWSPRSKDFANLSKPFFVEQKLDGERMLMHYDPSEDKFMWFSRNRTDYTRRYGDSSAKKDKLSSKIYQGLPKKSIVLDGELVAYDPMLKGFLPFGTLKSTSIDDKGKDFVQTNVQIDINDPTKPHPCLIVFDILFYSGKSILNVPFEERAKLLDDVVQNQNNHLMRMTRQTMYDLDEVKKALDEAIKLQQEGLVVKDPKKKYELNSRKPGWLKFKPDYMDALAEDCDVLIVGAKYGSGSNGGVFRQILCAVLDDRVSNANDPKFITFAMVHSGLKDTDVSTFNSIAVNGEKFVQGKVPGWLHHPLNLTEKPDQWFYFEDALVAEIKGSEIIPSGQFGLEHTLRFPRLIKFRHDKGWKDIMTFSDFKKMQQEGRRGKKRAAVEQAESEKKHERKKTYTLLDSQQGANVTHIPIVSQLFEGLTFYVMNGKKEKRKVDIEDMIHRNGGKFVQDTFPDTIIIGSDEDKHMPNRLRVFHDKRMHDVRKAQWIIDSVEMKDLLALEPKYMYVTLDETKAEFLTRMDEYGDNFTKYLNEEQTKQLLENIGNDQHVSDEQRRQICMDVMQESYSNEHESGFLFVDVVAYFDADITMSVENPPVPKTIKWVNWKKMHNETDIAKEKFKFEMGVERLDSTSLDITHVVVNKNDLSRFSLLKKNFEGERVPRFVTLDWIYACIDQRTFVDVQDYQPRIPIQIKENAYNN